ncbi:MAG: metallophosphoesterase [Bacteroidota bacterium]
MKILDLSSEPIAEFPYHNAGTRAARWGNRSNWHWTLPVLKGVAEGIPEELDALLLTSDLQGTVQENGETRLLGEVLPEFLAAALSIEMNLRPEKTGVLLCGDFFALVGRRGGLGDVSGIWKAFKTHFQWVAGVSGNHDDFGQNWNRLNRLRQEPGIFYLENNAVEIENFKLAGLSGVIGENGKHNYLPEIDFCQKLDALLAKRADLTLLHQNPFHTDSPRKGGKAVLDLLQRHPGRLLACGHAIWNEPLLLLENGTQVLNVAERAVVLKRFSAHVGSA